MSDTIEIRPAVAEDLTSLVELVRCELECQEQFSATFKLNANVDWVGYVAAKLRRSSSRILVAQASDEVVGFVEFRVARQGSVGSRGWLTRWLRRCLARGVTDRAAPVQPRDYGYVDDVFVLPDYRSRGLASQLLQAALEWFAAREIHQVEAAIWSANRASLGLFEKMGFQQVRILVGRSVDSLGPAEHPQLQRDAAD